MADMSDSVSQASLFFEALPADNAAAYQQLASMVIGEPQLEAEWIDYKSGLADDTAVKKHWGKALSGFANSSGGLIVWGIATRSMPGGLDAPSHLELVTDAAKLEARLSQLVNTSADPPVLGVRLRRVIDPTGGGQAGLVVALIPSSDLAPHRDEGTKIFYVRSGDQHHPARAGLLRHLFYPQVSPVLRLSYAKEHDRIFMISITNSGVGTAQEAFIGLIDSNQCIVVRGASAVNHLADNEPNPYLHHLFLVKPLHPLMTVFVASMYFHRDTHAILQVFAGNMRPLMWRLAYNRASDAVSLEGPRPIKLREVEHDEP
jgi:hypothetical protein